MASTAESRAARDVLQLDLDRVEVGGDGVEALLRVLELLHDLELLVLQGRDAPFEGTELVLQALEILRVGDRARAEPILVADPASLDVLDLGVGLRLGPSEVADLGVGLDALPVELVDLGLELGDARVLGEGRAAVVELGERGVLGLQIEQGQLGGRFGVQRVLLVLGMTCVHGSVTIVDTLVSTVSPHRAATSPAATGSHVHSAAQCGTSTTAHASSAFAVLAHRVVAQVGRDVHVGAGRVGGRQQEVSGSAAQRDRAHRRGRGRRRPGWRCCGAGRRSATWAAKSPRLIGSGSCPMRPLPRSDGRGAVAVTE